MLSARAAVVQFYSNNLLNLLLILLHQYIYPGLPLSMMYYHSNTDAPPLGILKIYEDLSRLVAII